MGITIKELAKLCNVSPGTVDRALNNRYGISGKTKERILKVAKEHHYRPDARAQSLVRGKTMTLGIVLFDLYNRSFAQMMNAIEKEARKDGYHVNLVLTDKSPEDEKKCIEQLISQKVDGIVLFSVNKGEGFADYLASLSTPIVTLSNYIADSLDFVGIRDRVAMKEAVDSAVQLGYEKIIYICPPLRFYKHSNIYTQTERYEGCLESLRAANLLEAHQLITDPDYLTALDPLSFEEKRTAIVCSCDYYALEILKRFKETNLIVGQDVGLVGFDNIDTLQYVEPALNTVSFDLEGMGSEAIRLLLNRIETDRAPIKKLLSHQLIRGASL
ncbi:LacI family DNA-binding transcriptional regulator [Aureibacillus halotolerans]|uniref:LacI family transcriptional regulator n=1 Tax=Aureibacillus halotolerans TaxID=1508390 RepID=A0A4R6TUM2_9BACI|nr:LacI family DNA-binding transcriptional regulator [Aureibacillus halotolerans]TDQ37438.1 LacI family transcriptional regulator [Aureibacillus halotolerans]